MYLVQALGRIADPSDTERLSDWARAATDWRIRSEAMVALAGRELEPGMRCWRVWTTPWSMWP